MTTTKYDIHMYFHLRRNCIWRGEGVNWRFDGV